MHSSRSGGDIRLDLFNHLSGQGTHYFVERLPGALAGRITAAANAAWTIENSLTWTTIPPGAAVVGSIIILGTINWYLTLVLLVVVAGLGVSIGRLAPRGSAPAPEFRRPCGACERRSVRYREQHRPGARLRRRPPRARSAELEESASRCRPSAPALRSLEILRLLHAVAVFTVTAGVLVWSVELWRRGKISTGEVVLTTTLGFTVLHASRDFAMALVDMVQQFAKLGEAVQVLGLPHEMQDAPDARPLAVRGGAIRFRNVGFSYPSGQQVLKAFDLEVPAGQKVGLVGRSGAASPRSSPCCSGCMTRIPARC